MLKKKQTALMFEKGDLQPWFDVILKGSLWDLYTEQELNLLEIS